MGVDAAGQQRLAGETDVIGAGDADIADVRDASVGDEDRLVAAPAAIEEHEVGGESHGADDPFPR